VDMPGWKVVNDGALTVALDITITDDLRSEGLAREFVNRVQNLRKDSGLEVTDRIRVLVRTNPHLDSALQLNSEYIRAQILAGELTLVESLENGQPVEIDEGIVTDIFIQKLK
jgi:isoleucyl-tRNA synthetase